MNHRNGAVTDEDSTKEYLNKMLANAEKHGIKITAAFYSTLYGHGYIRNCNTCKHEAGPCIDDMADCAAGICVDFKIKLKNGGE